MSDVDFTITQKVRFLFKQRGRREINPNPQPVPQRMPEGTVPRISRLMALAIHCDELIRSGAVADQAELARVGHVTRARVTQIMNLLLLAPDIQEALLFLPRTLKGRDAIRERDLRPIATAVDWQDQRRQWRAVTDQHSVALSLSRA